MLSWRAIISVSILNQLFTDLGAFSAFEKFATLFYDPAQVWPVSEVATFYSAKRLDVQCFVRRIQSVISNERYQAYPVFFVGFGVLFIQHAGYEYLFDEINTVDFKC